MEDNEIDTFGGKLSLKKETYKYIQDEQCSSAFAKQTIARQGDPAAHAVRCYAAFQQYGTLDLPSANCIRSECRTSNARPYVQIRRRSVRPLWSAAATGERPLRV